MLKKTAGPQSRVSDPAGLGGQGVRISYRFPDAIVLLARGPHLESHSSGLWQKPQLPPLVRPVPPCGGEVRAPGGQGDLGLPAGSFWLLGLGLTPSLADHSQVLVALS